MKLKDYLLLSLIFAAIVAVAVFFTEKVDATGHADRLFQRIRSRERTWKKHVGLSDLYRGNL